MFWIALRLCERPSALLGGGSVSRKSVTQRFKRDIFIKYINFLKMPKFVNHQFYFWGEKCQNGNSNVLSSFNFFNLKLKFFHFGIEFNWIPLSNSICSLWDLSNELLRVMIDQLWGFLAQNLNFEFWNLNNFKTPQGTFSKNDLPLTSFHH